MSASEEVDFGYERIPADEKVHRVGEVFSSVASRYDLMNDLMSVGLHRLWKQQALRLINARPGQRVLDLAAGTGDLSIGLAKAVGRNGQVVVSDINAAMLNEGRDRMVNEGLTGNLAYVLADAEQLPFPPRQFDRISMAFGLRNVTRIPRALAAIRAALRPGGQLVVLEFSQLYVASLRPLYDLYSFQLLPLMGRLVASDADSYRYLAESIRLHPDQETLQSMMEEAGFEDCGYINLSGGIVALHHGHVY
ncbi:demethylmenaquinone methyltransferase [Spiribacter salinus M19-40]|jgi:demethylmenaquinone methyltransferase/2-methoxy-6-polyprenyl-1,4-benzoquinol methylase|uniref:Ubiquinone/menaquinone biosynthesis C-methyltransferase UbiE n=1 Tax=Spiribacter salinus M19-40 TaxID=1260251 RepID=R4VCP3_9GAMM|nr:class I SAM-dependent methyltransferase [Spiribacter salinus]AGM40121.1 demethylmenaquinone methyltransferase [Spiribacter salinus M19-40]MBY5268647.1 bifunctional demethylmenaquinone methyltransferase/2-methoxy-6-polyprenyl-1,4-benzoquinol methylase [Spiribacter salinus]MDR9413869.1 class I SAM-dependent methyltransferase [Spiribacter sp.]MDR9455198.1 class I SAM-dependent methyltransferase [Spiribacter sp.]